MEDKFKSGDFVWAKMRGYPAWPSKVINHPLGHIKAKHYYVRFFGSFQFAWIAEKDLFPYFENIENLMTKSRQKIYKDAIIGIANAYQKYISQNEEAGTSGSNDQDDEESEPSESVQNEEAGTSGSNDQNDEESEPSESVQGNDDYVFKKKRIRTPEEMEERRRLINKRLRVRLLPLKNKQSKKVVKKTSRQKKQSSNDNSVITVKVKDYKKIITKELVILLERCDK